MLSDEQLIERIRSELHRELTAMQPPAGFLDHVWEQAHTDSPLARPPRPRRFAAPRRFGIPASALGTLAAVAVTVVIAVGALIFFGGEHHHSAPAVPAVPVVAPAGQPLTKILAVLRRPQTRQDHDPALLKRPPFRLTRLQATLGTPQLALIRLATVTPWGAKVFLVPMKPPTEAAIATLPAPERGAVERQLTRQGPDDRLGVFTVGQSGGGGCCATAQMIEQQGTGMWGGTSSLTQLVLVVPDGVAKVTLLLPRQGAHGARAFRRAQSLTATVHDNVFAIAFNRVVDDPMRDMIWYGPRGNIVKRFANSHNSTGA